MYNMNTYNYEQERQEAIDAGERALESLRLAKSELNSARTWGVFDLFGGGLISTLVKHSKMGHAQEYLEQAKRDLYRFSEELKDIDMYDQINVQAGDFLTFADFFFDGVIADWLVQDKINKARYQIDEAIGKVEQVLRRLR